MSKEKINIHLNDFDGPLELLLHLLRQSKMDIYDINIKEITNQYVDYLNKMKKMRIEIAGEFFVMAANLMRIKSQMLLAKETDTDDDEEDPREGLVAQLIEYKKYKRAALELREKEKSRNKYRSPEIEVNNNDVSINENEFQIEMLQRAWKRIIERRQLNSEVPIEHIAEWKYSINGQTTIIKDKLKNSPDHKIEFSKLVVVTAPVEELITDFLALLTMIKQQSVRVFQINDNDDITIKGVN